MNPSPEQIAYAFAMMNLRRSEADAPDGLVPTVSTTGVALRVVGMAIVGVCTALLGLSYIHGNVATGGRSAEELRSFGDPSPFYVLVEYDAEPTGTASIR